MFEGNKIIVSNLSRGNNKGIRTTMQLTLLSTLNKISENFLFGRYQFSFCFRGHIEDVYDLAWSPDSTQLITGSVDNSAIVWDAVKGLM